MEVLSIDLLIRIGASIGLGFLLGLERELTNKYAGLRTHILVCLGACIFTLISIYGFPTFAESDNVIVDNSTGISVFVHWPITMATTKIEIIVTISHLYIYSFLFIYKSWWINVH